MSWRRGNIPNAKKWARFRLTILERDGYRCCVCSKAGILEVDHIRGHDAGIFDPSNCQTLCRGCHIAKGISDRTKPNPEREAWVKFLAEKYSAKV